MDKIRLWVWSIDDILVIWSGTRDEFSGLVDILNQNDIGLRFTYEIHQSTLPFLDVRITKSPLGERSTTIYRKPPIPYFTGKAAIPCHRNAASRSDTRESELQAKDLGDCFREKGFPIGILRWVYNRALDTDRTNLLAPRQRKKDNPDPVRMIGTYDNAANLVRNIRKRHWHVVTMDPDMLNA